ncbi:hypothetical protein Pla52n_52610 [Stieleria varia]|uniref:Uncharacterized protein n=1 Tax=Stieleria varia TaxID=2528005 RepID=A0A5C6A4Z5_9BACT|nr:hypothetical protein Pla52n_52610 [Stieleria varia]
MTRVTRQCDCGAEFPEKTLGGMPRFACPECGRNLAAAIQDLEEPIANSNLESSTGLYRDSSYLVIDMRKYLFPNRCIVTNNPTRNRITKCVAFVPNSRTELVHLSIIVLSVVTYSFTGLVVNALFDNVNSIVLALLALTRILASTTVFFLYWMFIVHIAELHVPVSDEALHKLGRNKWLGRVLCAIGLLTGLFSFVLGLESERFFWGVLIGAPIFSLGAIWPNLSKRYIVRCTKATRHHIWLAGCSPSFLESLPNVKASSRRNSDEPQNTHERRNHVG